MTAPVVDLYRRAQDAGLSLVARDGRLVVSPSHRLTKDMRQELVEHKVEVLQFLEDSRATTEELLAAAMNACDYWCDGPHAREEMRRQVIETPAHLRSELLCHLRATYKRGNRA